MNYSLKHKMPSNRFPLSQNHASTGNDKNSVREQYSRNIVQVGIHPVDGARWVVYDQTIGPAHHVIVHFHFVGAVHPDPADVGPETPVSPVGISVSENFTNLIPSVNTN